MNMNSTKYNLNAIREMIMHAFNDDQLNSFSFDHFRSAYRHMTVRMSKTKKVSTLVDEADRSGQIELLLEKVKNENEFQYMNYYQRIINETANKTHSRPEQTPSNPPIHRLAAKLPLVFEPLQNLLKPSSYIMIGIILLLLGAALLIFLFPKTPGLLFLYIALFPIGLGLSLLLFGLLRPGGRADKPNRPTPKWKYALPLVLFLVSSGIVPLLIPIETSFDFVFSFQAAEKGIRLKEGKMTITIGKTLRSESIPPDGKVIITSIPATARKADTQVELHLPGWVFKESNQKKISIKLTGQELTLRLKRDKSRRLLKGKVLSATPTVSPLPGATITIANQSTQTDENGMFSITISKEYQADEYEIKIEKEGYLVLTSRIIPFNISGIPEFKLTPVPLEE